RARAGRPTTSTPTTCSTRWRRTAPGTRTETASEQVPAEQVPLHRRPRPRARRALPERAGGGRRVVGAGTGQPHPQLPRGRVEHLAALRRRRARRPRRARLREAVRAGRAPVPHADAVHRDVRTRLRRAARVSARVRAEPLPHETPVPRHSNLTVRAAEIHKPGDLPVVVERDAPVPGDGAGLVEGLAAPLAPLDVLCATGTSYFGKPATPYVPGVQGVGRVDGRTVWFPTSAGMAPGDGSMAEVAAVPEDTLVGL